MLADTVLADNLQAVITNAIDDLHGVASDLIDRINAPPLPAAVIG
jgi:hypothetical protein